MVSLKSRADALARSEAVNPDGLEPSEDVLTYADTPRTFRAASATA